MLVASILRFGAILNILCYVAFSLDFWGHHLETGSVKKKRSRFIFVLGVTH
jgi:hypothetical protein